jgi:alkylhydroperoxidase family enzyme
MSARLPYLERDQAPPEIQAIFDALLRSSGRVLNFYRLVAHHAASLPAFIQWYPKLREGALDPRLRELAYVKAAQLNGCRY